MLEQTSTRWVYVAYELLTGRLPFDGITHKSAPLEVLEAHKAGNPTGIAKLGQYGSSWRI